MRSIFRSNYCPHIILFTIIIVLLFTAINAQQFKKRLPKETYKKENRLFKTDNSISKTDRFIFNMKTKNAAVRVELAKLKNLEYRKSLERQAKRNQKKRKKK